MWLASFDGDGDARWAVLANGVLPTEAVVDGLGVGGGLIALAKAGGMQAWSAGVGGPSVIGLGAAPAATDLAVAPDGRVYAVAPKEDGVLLTAWTDALAPRWTFVVAGSFGSRPRVAVGTAERIAIVGGSSIARVDDGGWAPAPAPAQ